MCSIFYFYCYCLFFLLNFFFFFALPYFCFVISHTTSSIEWCTICTKAHHMLPLDTATPHDHAATILSTTTVSPLDVMGHGEHVVMSDQHAMHNSHDHGAMNMEGAMHHMMSMAVSKGFSWLHNFN